MSSEYSPLVSVIMGIYNCEETLHDALQCIAKQTYTNWEVIMCDDGSEDDTRGIADAFAEEYPGRVTVLHNDENMGLNYTLNRCLAAASGSLIARMDGDDLCSTVRFEVELSALARYPEISFVSTDMVFFDNTGVWGRSRSRAFPTKKDFLHATPFCHAPCMVRREAYEAVGGYSVDKRLIRVEDYHLWVKMYENGLQGMNIQEPLYQMRDDRDALIRKKFRYRLHEVYVKGYAISHLHLPWYYYIFCVKPILIGLLPRKAYSNLHKRRAAGNLNQPAL